MARVSSGLNCLASIDRIFVYRQVEMIEIRPGLERRNCYVVKNASGQPLLFVTEAEKSNCCEWHFCGGEQPSRMWILDSNRVEVFRVERKSLGTCTSTSCLHRMDVQSPPNNPIGSIREECAFCRPSYEIRNESANVLYNIRAPFCRVGCCSRGVNFEIKPTDGCTVGRIAKYCLVDLGGLSQTRYDYYEITFPTGADLRSKALMLGASFLIDYKYYESYALYVTMIA